MPLAPDPLSSNDETGARAQGRTVRLTLMDGIWLEAGYGYPGFDVSIHDGKELVVSATGVSTIVT